MSKFDRSSDPPRQVWPLLLRIGVSIALIALFVTVLGGEELLAKFRACAPLLFLGACALFFSGQILNALRWRWLLAMSVSKVPSLAHLIASVMVGMFFNLFLPSTVGGDIAPAELVRGQVGGRTQAYLSILVGSFLAFTAVVVIGLTAIMAGYVGFGWFDPRTLVATLIFSLPLVGLWLAFRSRRVDQWWLRYGLRRLRKIVSQAKQAMDGYRTHPDILKRVFFVAIVANLVGNGLAVWALAACLDVNVPFYIHLIAVPLILLVTLVPISFNGIGIREGAFAYFYGQAASAWRALFRCHWQLQRFSVCSAASACFCPRFHGQGAPRRLELTRMSVGSRASRQTAAVGSVPVDRPSSSSPQETPR